MAHICWALRPFVNFDEKRRLSKPCMTKIKSESRWFLSRTPTYSLGIIKNGEGPALL
jgi:hypothetical protein